MQNHPVCEKAVRRSIGLTVLRLRHNVKITQSHLSRLVGVKRQYISQLESGSTSPELTTILRLCPGLEVCPSEFLQTWFKTYLEYARLSGKQARESSAQN